MRKIVSLKKGLNLRLAGGLDADVPAGDVSASRVAVVPDDFPGFSPKPEVGEGDLVAAGSPLLRDKSDPRIKLVSPVAGRVESVVRGARRKIERVVVVPCADAADSVKNSSLTYASAGAEELRTALMGSGLWAMMRRRPYDIVPLPADKPRTIMVTAMDTAPLAAGPEAMVAGRKAEIQAGADALRKMTGAPIYIGVKSGSALSDVEGAEIYEFPALHPAGNAGVQIANIEPVNKGEVVWTLDIVTLARIGRFVMTGEADWSVEVAVTGSEVVCPKMVRTVAGACLTDVLDGNVKDDGRHHRVISGNVLTGVHESPDGFLRYPYRQVTVIPEGDDVDEFMGWASVSPSKMSVSPSFIGRFLKRKFSPDARLNGGRRAMIMSGEYDKVFPMDILPEYLIKAIIARDIDRMEALGIYEVAPEDFALAEYVDPSKLELQKIVREGLDYLRAEV